MVRVGEAASVNVKIEVSMLDPSVLVAVYWKFPQRDSRSVEVKPVMVTVLVG